MGSQPTPYDALLEAAAELLREEEWNVLVIGGVRITKAPGKPKFVHCLEIEFTGTRPEGGKGE